MPQAYTTHRPALLQVRYAVEPPYLIITLTGEIDACNCGALCGCPDLTRVDLCTVLLDLGELTFCDGSGLRALLALGRQQREMGLLFGAPRIHPRVRDLMEICGVADSFPPWEAPPG